MLITIEKKFICFFLEIIHLEEIVANDWKKINDHMVSPVVRDTEPIFVNVYGAQESIPRKRFHQSM
jgi:hypothetical protein